MLDFDFSLTLCIKFIPCVNAVFLLKFVCVFVCFRYILDLNKRQEAGFVEKVASLALEAGFEPWREHAADDVYAVFVPQKK